MSKIWKYHSFESFQDADADGSGSVDFTEFVELMIKREAEKETPEDLKQAFRVFDKVTEGLKCINFILHLTHPIFLNVKDINKDTNFVFLMIWLLY